jgi:hypothetical protein
MLQLECLILKSPIEKSEIRNPKSESEPGVPTIKPRMGADDSDSHSGISEIRDISGFFTSDFGFRISPCAISDFGFSVAPYGRRHFKSLTVAG